MKKLTVCYSIHRPETLSLTARVMEQHQVIILEEPPHEDFSRVLSGHIPLEEHLLELDVDTLKVDQAFIKNLKENRKARQLLQGIVNLAKGVGYNIVAEGLESEEHLNALSVLKVDYGQGWLVGKPQSFDEIMQHLQNGA